MNAHVTLIAALLTLCLLPAPAFAGVKLQEPTRQDALRGSVHVLAVGIDHYRNDTNLKYAAQDAIAVAAAFGKLGATVTTLLETAASPASIEKALADQAQQLKSDDVFIFMFSGFGYSSSGDFYFKTPETDPRNMKEITSGIPATKLWAWLDRMQAKHLLVILDTGDASGFLTVVNDNVAKRPFGQADRDISIIAPRGESFEFEPLGHSQLSYSILLSLGKDSDLNKDGVLTAAEFEAATAVNAIRVQTAAPTERMGRGQLTFRIGSYSLGKDFPIGRLEPGSSRGTSTFREENPPPAQTLKGEYHALLIATDEYKEWKPLKNPVNDARAIEKELTTRYGFKTRLVPNPDVETFRKEIADLKGMRFGPK